MDPVLAIMGGILLFFLLFVLALGAWHPRSGNRIVGRSLRDPGAEAQIESEDIDQMLDARDERRRARGEPTLADELADEARRPPQ